MTRSSVPRRIRLGAAAVACAAFTAGAGLISAPAAGAHIAPTAYSHHHHKHGTSYEDGTWGGYVAQGDFHSITGSWTEPQLQCNSSSDLFAPWVGIDGWGSQSVEQTGVQTDCSSGSPVYSAWYEMYPADPVFWNDPVNAGDSFTGSVTDEGSGNYTITLTDNTAGWTETTQQYYGGQDASAEAVIESPSNSYPSFSELDFSGITVDGQVFDAYSPQAVTSGGYGPGPLQNGSFSMGSEYQLHAKKK